MAVSALVNLLCIFVDKLVKGFLPQLVEPREVSSSCHVYMFC